MREPWGYYQIVPTLAQLPLAPCPTALHESRNTFQLNLGAFIPSWARLQHSLWAISQVCSLCLDSLKGFWIFHCICLRLLVVAVINALLGFCRLAHGSVKVLPDLVSPLGCLPSCSNPILSANILKVHHSQNHGFGSLLQNYLYVKKPWIKFKWNAENRDSTIVHSKWLL